MSNVYLQLKDYVEVALFLDLCQSISVQWWQCQITDILRYQVFSWQLSSVSFRCVKDMRERFRSVTCLFTAETPGMGVYWYKCMPGDRSSDLTQSGQELFLLAYIEAGSSANLFPSLPIYYLTDEHSPTLITPTIMFV